MTPARRAWVGRYILNGHEPEPCDDLLKWAAWFETADRGVGKDDIAGLAFAKWVLIKPCQVSTVFLALDHCFWESGPPVLFETMVFGGINDETTRRYATWDEAVAGHQQLVRLCRWRWPADLLWRLSWRWRVWRWRRWKKT